MTRIATGLRRPSNPGVGLDVAGVVEVVGKDATRFRPGDEVYGDMTEFGHGAYGEYVSAPEKAFAKIPTGVSLEDAASTGPQAGILAIQGLNAEGPDPGGGQGPDQRRNGERGSHRSADREVHGGGGDRCCQDRQAGLVRSLGADHVIDYTRDDFTELGERYDRILDMADYRGLPDIRHALTSRGVYIAIGGKLTLVFGAMVVGFVMPLAGKQRAGLPLWKPFNPPDVVELSRMLADGTIKPVIDRRYPLSEVPDALRHVDGRHAKGKVVITV